MDRSHSGSTSGESPDQHGSNETSDRKQNSKTSAKTRPNETTSEPNKAGPSTFQKIKTKINLDVPTLMIMLKAGVAPAICTAALQSDTWASTYQTVGYLTSIMSILGMAIMPRAKFIQTMFINVVMVCFAAALNLLALWSSIQARKHKGPPVGYSSSQSAVCAIWLFFMIYVINTIKSARPQFMFPVIISSIFCVVSMTTGPRFPTMDACITFIVRLIGAFLTGFAIATGVSFVIFPMTSRLIMFKMFTGYLATVGKVLKAQAAYMVKLEEGQHLQSDEDDEHGGGKETGDGNIDMHARTRTILPPSAEEKQLKGALSGLIELQGKLKGEVVFAKRETAFGKLTGKDIEHLVHLMGQILLPLIAMGSVSDLVRRIAEVEEWSHADREVVFADWQSVLKVLHDPFQTVTADIQEGISHVMLRLEFVKSPKPKDKKTEDPEEKGGKVSPGEDTFAEYFERQTEQHFKANEVSLREWCELKGLDVPEESIQEAWQHQQRIFGDETHHLYIQRLLFIILYMDYLLHRCYKATDELVKFADSKVRDGTMKRKRLIWPAFETIKEWVLNLHKEDHDSNNEDHKVMSDYGSSFPEVKLGDAYSKRRDPEHLPARTAVEKAGNVLRLFPRALRSEHSIFGFRVAAATMSIAIIAYLKDSYAFFNQQRVLWALIMVSFSMTRTAGQSTFGFIARIAGTVFAMIASYVIWYMADQKTPGVIVFLYIWIAFCFYFLIKTPQYAPVAIISAITAVLINGYELQVRKLGVAVSEASGQPFYPLYKFAPYRLLTVVAGLACAYFWTIFPYPITESFALRQDIGKCLYLCANFNSITHESVGTRIRGDGGSADDPSSPAGKLESARATVFAKTLTLVSSLKASAAFSKWEVHVGGRFPAHTYNNIITRLERILLYTALVEYASRSFDDPSDPHASEHEKDAARTSGTHWLHDLRRLLRAVKPTTHDVTSVLCLLSSALTSAVPLPPYMRLPKPYQLTRRLEAVDRDILDVRHIAEPGYSAFAVLQVASRVVVADVVALAAEVKKLVGELDFSFHAVDVKDGNVGYGSDEETLAEGGKGKQD